MVRVSFPSRLESRRMKPDFNAAKYLTAVGLLVATSLASAQQVPHQFQEGGPYGARPFNENFEYLAKEIAALKEASRDVIPSGSIVLMTRPCPEKGFLDVTELWHGKYIVADKTVQGQANIIEADGSHEHIGPHDHPVNLKTSPLGIGQRKGTLDRDTTVPHENTTLDVKGKTGTTELTLHGGVHRHAAIGVRVCQKR